MTVEQNRHDGKSSWYAATLLLLLLLVVQPAVVAAQQQPPPAPGAVSNNEDIAELAAEAGECSSGFAFPGKVLAPPDRCCASLLPFMQRAMHTSGDEVDVTQEGDYWGEDIGDWGDAMDDDDPEAEAKAQSFQDSILSYDNADEERYSPAYDDEEYPTSEVDTDLDQESFGEDHEQPSYGNPSDYDTDPDQESFDEYADASYDNPSDYDTNPDEESFDEDGEPSHENSNSPGQQQTSIEDPYEILGVSQSATQAELRKAYRTLSLKWHPDKNPASMAEASARFASIAAAWERVRTPDARAIYDDFGENSKGFNTYEEFQQHREEMGREGQTPSDLYQGEQYVTRLTDADFDQHVTSTDSAGQTLYWVLNMYAPWCSHCVAAVGSYKRVAEDMDGVVEFGAVNCEANPYLCSTDDPGRFPISIYPTVIMLSSRYKMTSVFEGQLSDQEQLTEWILSTKVEWERLESVDGQDSAVVQLLNASAFQSTVLQSTDMWLVMYTLGADDHQSQQAKANYLRLGSELKARHLQVKLATFECTMTSTASSTENDEAGIDSEELCVAHGVTEPYPHWRVFKRCDERLGGVGPLPTFSHADADGDGTVSEKEWTTVMGEQTREANNLAAVEKQRCMSRKASGSAQLGADIEPHLMFPLISTLLRYALPSQPAPSATSPITGNVNATSNKCIARCCTLCGTIQWHFLKNRMGPKIASVENSMATMATKGEHKYEPPSDRAEWQHSGYAAPSYRTKGDYFMVDDGGGDGGLAIGGG